MDAPPAVPEAPVEIDLNGLPWTRIDQKISRRGRDWIEDKSFEQVHYFAGSCWRAGLKLLYPLEGKLSSVADNGETEAEESSAVVNDAESVPPTSKEESMLWKAAVNMVGGLMVDVAACFPPHGKLDSLTLKNFAKWIRTCKTGSPLLKDMMANTLLFQHFSFTGKERQKLDALLPNVQTAIAKMVTEKVSFELDETHRFSPEKLMGWTYGQISRIFVNCIIKLDGEEDTDDFPHNLKSRLLESADKTLVWDPESVDGWVAKSFHFEKSGNLKEATETLIKAAMLAPKNSQERAHYLLKAVNMVIHTDPNLTAGDVKTLARNVSEFEQDQLEMFGEIKSQHKLELVRCLQHVKDAPDNRKIQMSHDSFGAMSRAGMTFLPTDMEKPKTYSCGFCRKKNEKKMNCCSRCKLVYYCDRSCQKKDWKYHKNECTPPQT